MLFLVPWYGSGADTISSGFRSNERAGGVEVLNFAHQVENQADGPEAGAVGGAQVFNVLQGADSVLVEELQFLRGRRLRLRQRAHALLDGTLNPQARHLQVIVGLNPHPEFR